MDIKKLLHLPDLLDVKKVVAVQPHPDDNEVNIGGTLMALRDRGCEIGYVTVTDGSAGAFGSVQSRSEIVQVRAQEKKEAGDIIGVQRHVDLGLTDGSDYSTDALTTQLVGIFREEQPEVVFSVDPWMPYEAHPDHVKVGMAVSRAILFSNNAILYPETTVPIYQVPQVAYYATSYPNTFIDITTYFEKKLASIFAHKSQFDNGDWELMKQYFAFSANESYRQLKQGNDGFAEALKVLSHLQLHALPSTVYS